MANASSFYVCMYTADDVCVVSASLTGVQTYTCTAGFAHLVAAASGNAAVAASPRTTHTCAAMRISQAVKTTLAPVLRRKYASSIAYYWNWFVLLQL